MKTLIHFSIANIFILVAFIFSCCKQVTEPTVNTVADKTANKQLNKAKPEKPFKGNVLYTFSSMDADKYYLSGTGNLTHLGKSTTVETIYFAERRGEDTFTAADNSQIHMTWNAVDNGTFTWKIDGGTRRFEGATGSGVCPPVVENPDGTIEVEFIGIIKY
jgi:hypothetical protein